MNYIKIVVLIHFLMPLTSFSMDVIECKPDHVDEIIAKYHNGNTLTPLIIEKLRADKVLKPNIHEQEAFLVPYGAFKKFYPKQGTHISPDDPLMKKMIQLVESDDEIMKKLGWNESRTTNEQAKAVVIWSDGSCASLIHSFCALAQQAKEQKLPERIFFIEPFKKSAAMQEFSITINRLIEKMVPGCKPEFTDQTKPANMRMFFHWLLDLKQFENVKKIGFRSFDTVDSFNEQISKDQGAFTVYTASMAYNYDLEQILTKLVAPDNVRIVRGCCYFQELLPEEAIGPKKIYEFRQRNYILGKIFSCLGRKNFLDLKLKVKKAKKSNECGQIVYKGDIDPYKDINAEHKENCLKLGHEILSDQIDRTNYN